jgi:mediator of RNA polymerase II transcription subunit 21
MPQLGKIPKNQPAAVPMPAGALQSQAQTQTQNSPTANPPPQQLEGPGAPLASSDPNLPPTPDSPRTFGNRQRELARDLIVKEQQIEYLISRLPGIGSSEAEQESRIRELEAELRAVENERERKARELKRLGKKLDKVLGTVEKGIYGERDDLG